MKPSASSPFSLPNLGKMPGLVTLAGSVFMAAGAFATSMPAWNTPVVVAQAAAHANPGSTGAKPLAVTPAHASPSAAATAPEAKPIWKDLTIEQQQSLEPLAANWSALSDGQKRKWIALSRNFPAKTPVEQAKLHSRMTEWVSLSQQQRTQARLNFAETKTLSRDEKAAQWKAYQALSPEEKKKLAAKGPATPAGATSAVKPVPDQKLAKVPATRRTQPVGTAAAHHPKVDANTLLPLAPDAHTSAEAATAPRN